LLLARRGFHVWAGVRSDADRQEVLDRAADLGGALEPLLLDVTDPASLDAAFSHISSTGRPLFGVVNNAGISRSGYFEDLDEAEIRRVLDVNIYGAMAVTRRALPMMRAAGTGRVVMISSFCGRIASLAVSPYVVSKFALEGWSESLSLEVAPLGIKVVLIEPGLIPTTFFDPAKRTAAGARNEQSPYYEWFKRADAEADALVDRARTTAEDVASKVFAALTLPRPALRYVVGQRAKWLIGLRQRLPDRVFESLYYGEMLRRVTGRRRPAVARGAASSPPPSKSHGKAVLITGASTGLGRTTALRLAARGYAVYATMLNLDERGPLEEAARERGLNLRYLTMDVRDARSIEQAVATVVGECGGIFALVNSAGTRLRGCFEDLTDAEIKRLFDTNVFGMMAVVRAVLPHMRSAGGGRVVLITSIAGRIGSFGVGAYCASKFAQEGFGESLAQEIAPFGIRLSLVEPGIIRTEAWSTNRVTAAAALNPESPYAEWFGRAEALADRLVQRSRTVPDDVAAVIEEALEAPTPRLRYVVGRNAKIVLACRRQLPAGIFETLYFGQLLRMITRPARNATVDARSSVLRP
jgi:NAD(P)-dependent dehydrogenase (short-subunit alcohol dehydrogenase family)